MKKLVLLTFSFLLVSALYSQQRAVTYGVKAGLNVSQIYHKLLSDGSDLRFAPVAGAFVCYRFGCNDRMGLQTEVLYSARGGRNGHVKRAYDYIDVPLLLKIRLFRGFDLNLGAQYGYLFSAENRMKDVKPEAILDARKHSFSWVGGVSYDISKRIFIDGRLVGALNRLQLSKVEKDNKLYSSTAALTLGLRF